MIVHLSLCEVLLPLCWPSKESICTQITKAAAKTSVLCEGKTQNYLIKMQRWRLWPEFKTRGTLRNVVCYLAPLRTLQDVFNFPIIGSGCNTLWGGWKRLLYRWYGLYGKAWPEPFPFSPYHRVQQTFPSIYTAYITFLPYLTVLNPGK
jgi:hypothetical protein